MVSLARNAGGYFLYFVLTLVAACKGWFAGHILVVSLSWGVSDDELLCMLKEGYLDGDGCFESNGILCFDV
ncbi:hypothetical protein BUALT_Bualt01G0064000 [Buddleja alternifolia]|uniref:Uncharacterized protein n=1 Tax=Buddleja alternifolia TaxID=168488 RepID=A0AAV6YFE2_9LAMI|nr:hypothetical protein BUALT_Bualt01G0064000 [Buddleja alternifolia]